MAIRLVAVDLDGTLLTNDKRISPTTVVSVQAARDRGVRIVIATTRNLIDARAIAADLGISAPVICANGARVYSTPDGNLWAEHLIPRAAALELACLADDSGWELATTVGDITYLRQRPGQPLGHLSDDRWIVPTNAAAITADTLRILAWERPAVCSLRAHCAERLSHSCISHIYFSPTGEPESLGIFPLLGDKGTALHLVMERLGIPRDEVMAIGDNDNDEALLEAAGLGVAMENGTEALREHADAVAPSNESDGVAWAIERFVLAP